MSRIRSLAARIAALEGRVDGAVMAEAARELLAGREPRCSPAVRAEAERLAADLREIDRIEGRVPCTRPTTTTDTTSTTNPSYD